MTQMESSYACGLTRVSENEIAVRTDNIRIYSVTDKFVLKKTIRNTQLYDAIDYTDGVFIDCTQTQSYNLLSQCF